MFVKKAVLTNFLSYKNASVEFDAGLNLIVGKNAEGKTNLADSVYYASVAKSSKNLKDKELIHWGADGGARITLTVAKKYSDHIIDIYIDAAGKKRITVDGLPIQKIGELMGTVNVVFFSPNELRLIKDGPAERRRFLDISLCQQSKVYFYTLIKYNKLLAQRNKLLKTYRGRDSLTDMLNLTDRELIKSGAYIIGERYRFTNALGVVSERAHTKLTGGAERLCLAYESENIDYANIELSLNAIYKSALAQDMALEYTTAGPHRDDLKIAVSGVDLRKFGSQGQQRSGVLSLKLAEIEQFKAKTGEYPVFILDDVISELDDDRCRALFGSIENVQTIITATDYPSRLFPTPPRLFRIKDKHIFNE